MIRTPIRDDVPNQAVGSAKRLLATLADPIPHATLVIASLVTSEWQDNIESVVDELGAHLRRLDRDFGKAYDCGQALDLTISEVRPDLTNSGLAIKLRQLSEDLLRAAIVLQENDELRLRSCDRVINLVPPARKGGGLKDCQIVEECLETSRQLTSAGFTQPLVFCTSNTRDYCERGVTLHANLASDFAAVGLRFYANLPWALHEIGM